jgi:choline dehydrogenase-like flavoprotein
LPFIHLVFVDTMTYARGTADDYDRFAKVTGDSSWSWKGVQKYFQLVSLFLAADGVQGVNQNYQNRTNDG